jgi:hypothetical protein
MLRAKRMNPHGFVLEKNARSSALSVRPAQPKIMRERIPLPGR